MLSHFMSVSASKTKVYSEVYRLTRYVHNRRYTNTQRTSVLSSHSSRHNFTQTNSPPPPIFCKPHQHSDGGWNDNKWAPLEELLAIKGNREPQYTTPVSLAKLKQITPTSTAYYAPNENDLFIIIILMHLFNHHWPAISMVSIASFPVCKHDQSWTKLQ